MRTPEENAKTREQVLDLLAPGIRLNTWENGYIMKQGRWIAASKAPFWTDLQAAKIEQIWGARVK